MEGTNQINPQPIIQALCAIHTPGASPTDIKQANVFLTECEQAPQYFSTTLLSIYCESSDYQLQMSSLLLLTNVIKRNWNPKRNVNPKALIKPDLKQQLRTSILNAYFLHEMRHYKHFNTLIGYLARIDFPTQYIGLHTFIINSLTQLIDMVKNDLQTVLKSNRVLIVLSACKVILKEYNHKKIAHNEEVFLKFITNIIQVGVNLSEQLFQIIKDNMKADAADALVGLFECLRKIDKVILYGLGSMPSSYQYKPQIQGIVKTYIFRVDQLNNLFDQLVNRSFQAICQQIQKYFIGIVEQLGRLQNYFPFMFSQFLKQYLYLILKMLVTNIPKAKYYQNDKLLSVIITANLKPLTSFPYYMTSDQFKNSIYSRQKSDFDNTQIQRHCHSIFREVYSPSSITQLIQTIIGDIMTAPHVLKNHKQFSDQLVLEDVEIAIVDQPSDSSVYDNCISLLKQVVKCFKEESKPFVASLIDKVHQLKFSNDRYSHQVFANILELVLVIPHIYDEKSIPIGQICGVISTVYEANMFSHLSRIIRKYHSHLPANTLRGCFEILAKVVSTPINNSTITPQIIYQSALGLKTLMGGMDSQTVPVQVLASCISNIVSLVGMKEFIACPTLMWPIVNLLIRLIKNLYDINKELVGDAASIIINGLAPLLSSQTNEELLVCGLAELVSTLFYCCFRGIKLQYHIRGRPVQPFQKIQTINKNSFLVFDAALVFLKCNIHNRSLQNNYTIHRFWLSLLRSYPSIYTQQIYDFQLTATNNKMIQFFNAYSKELLEDDPVIFLQILQQYFITQLVDLNSTDLLGIIKSKLQEEEEVSEKRLRVIMASASLYYSYSLLRAPVMEIVQILFKEFLQLYSRVSPQVNSLRTMLFLIFGQHLLNHNGGQIYSFFTNACGGDVGRWFIPYLWNMHFVTNKFAFKLNAAILLKAIADIGAQNYAQLMVTQFGQQYAVDEFLKIITIQLKSVNIDFMANSYNNITKNLLPNEIVPQFEVPSYRKTRLHLSDPLLINVARMDLVPELRTQLGEVLRVLDWSSADLEQRVGETAALNFCDYLGWERKII